MPPRGRGNNRRGGRRASGTSSSAQAGPIVDGLRMESDIIASAITADAIMAADRVQHLDLATQLDQPVPEPEPGFAARTMRRGALRPPQVVFVVVPYLSKIEYKDSEDKSVMSDGYISQQRKVLDYELTKAIDDLTPYEARKFTEDIAPNKEPAAKEALRLCYYMRQWDFSTYCKIKDGCISLFVIDRGTAHRGFRDVLYWKQNFVTNEVMYRAPNTDVHRLVDQIEGERDILEVLHSALMNGENDHETHEVSPAYSSSSQIVADLRTTYCDELDRLNMGGNRLPRRKTEFWGRGM